MIHLASGVDRAAITCSFRIDRSPNVPVPIAPHPLSTGQVQDKLKRLLFGLNFPSDLAKRGVEASSVSLFASLVILDLVYYIKRQTKFINFQLVGSFAVDKETKYVDNYRWYHGLLLEVEDVLLVGHTGVNI